MKNLTLTNIAEACGATLYHVKAGDTREIAGAVIDSRQVEQDFLFFAIRGEKVDGHDYIGKAFEAGAMAVVCEHIPEGCEGALLVVEDTLAALRQIAAFYRKQLDIRVVGITGSVGKTSTKEFIAGVLSEKYRVLKTEMNYNNEIGVPLMVLRIRDEHEIAVLEMGISDFGEMSRLAEITRPDIGVITNIGQSHLEKLIDQEGIKKAKTEMFEYMNPEGDVVLFGDDDHLCEIKEVHGKTPLFYGTKENSCVRAIDIINRGLWGSICEIRTEAGEFSTEIHLPGKHMVYNALAATTVGLLCGLTTEEIARGIANVKSVAGRSNIIIKNGITLIDDCYNANPASMKAAIDLLQEALDRRVAILGDMFELGEDEVALHEEVGRYVADKADVLICIGTLSEAMYNAACETQIPAGGERYFFQTKEEFLKKANELIQIKDSVLVKASHGMKFAEIVAEFTGDDQRWGDADIMREEAIEERTQGEITQAKETQEKETLQETQEREVLQKETQEKETQTRETQQETQEKEPQREETQPKETQEREVQEMEELEKETQNKDSDATECEETKNADTIVSDTDEAAEHNDTAVDDGEIKQSEDANAVDLTKKQKKKKIIVIASIIAAVLLLGVGTILFLNVQKANQLTAGIMMYTKDNTLYGVPASEPVAYTDNFISSDAGELSPERIQEIIVQTTRTSANGKTIYYPKEYDTTDEIYDLYYNKINGKSKTEELVDTRVTSYELDAKNNIFYLKKDALYYYDAKEETSSVFSENVQDFRLNEAADSVLYLTNGELLVQKLETGATPVSLDTEVTTIDAYASDFATVIYHKDKALYLLSEQNEKIRLSVCGELRSVTDIDKNYTICFDNTESSSPIVSEFMKNDLKSGSDRDAFIEELNNTEVGLTTTQLCRYKKGDAAPEVIVPYLLDIVPVVDGEDVLLIQQISLKKSEKVSMKKQYKDGADVGATQEAVKTSIIDSERYAIVFEGKLMPFKKYEGGTIVGSVYDNNVSGIYFTATADDSEQLDLYYADYRWFAKGKARLTATDISNLYGIYQSDAVYTKANADETESLYVEDTLISSSAANGEDALMPLVTADLKSLLYVGSDEGLYIYNKSGNEKIANNVTTDYFGVSDKNVWYIRDYDEAVKEGDLVRYNGEETVVDTCVFRILYLFEE